jgi:hypothetical protein
MNKFLRRIIAFSLKNRYFIEIGSPELDSVLDKLKWDNETLERLREKLARTNCDWIRILDSTYP